MFYKGATNFKKDQAQEILGDNLYFDLLNIEQKTILDKTLFGFFDRCYILNQLLSKYGFFIRFFERRNMYRFLKKINIKKKKKKKRGNKKAFCLRPKKFDGYEIIKDNLRRKGKVDFRPIDIVHEPCFDENTPVLCFYSDIHLAYESYIGLFKDGKEKIYNRIVRQCYYCNNFFARSKDNMDKHLSNCAEKEGITYSFDNAQIIDYQDNYKYMADVSFSVYFDFETTTGDAVFFVSKMFVVSYCMIFSFNKALNYDTIVIFRSFQQSANQLYDISHFKQEHVPFFGHVTLRQLKDAASAALFREKCSSLAVLY